MPKTPVNKLTKSVSKYHMDPYTGIIKFGQNFFEIKFLKDKFL